MDQSNAAEIIFYLLSSLNKVHDLPADSLSVQAIFVDELGGGAGLSELIAQADAGEAERCLYLLGEALGNSTPQTTDDAVFLGCDDFAGLCRGSQWIEGCPCRREPAAGMS